LNTQHVKGSAGLKSGLMTMTAQSKLMASFLIKPIELAGQ
jgi:hypothetical protein